MSGTRNSQFQRGGSSSGGKSVAFNMPVVIEEIVQGAAPPSDNERWKLGQADVENYAHIKARTTIDILKNDGSIQVPRGTAVSVLVFAKGENARTIENLENPAGKQPYITVGDTLNLSRTYARTRKIEGSDELDVVLHAGRINNGMSALNEFQPMNPDTYFSLPEAEQQEAEFYAKGGVFSGQMVVMASSTRDDKEFQSIVVVDDALGHAVDSIDGVKAALEEQQNNAYSRVGVNAVSVVLYRKPGPDVDPNDLGNRIACLFAIPDKKLESGAYAPQTPDELFNDIRNSTSKYPSAEHQKSVLELMESGEWDITVMPAKRFSMPKSMLPKNPENALGDRSLLFSTLDLEKEGINSQNLGYKRGYVIASCTVVGLDEEGKRVDTDAQGQLMVRQKGVLTPSGKAAPQIIVGGASAWTVETYDNNPFDTLEVSKAIAEEYAAEAPTSIAEQKKVLKEAQGAAIKKFGGLGSSPRPTESPASTFDSDIICPGTPKEYVDAIKTGLKEERTLYTTLLKEQQGRVPELGEKKENAPSP